MAHVTHVSMVLRASSGCCEDCKPKHWCSRHQNKPYTLPLLWIRRQNLSAGHFWRLLPDTWLDYYLVWPFLEDGIRDYKEKEVPFLYTVPNEGLDKALEGQSPASYGLQSFTGLEKSHCSVFLHQCRHLPHALLPTH